MIGKFIRRLKDKSNNKVENGSDESYTKYKGYTLEEYKQQLKDLKAMQPKNIDKLKNLERKKKNIEIYILSMEYLQESN